MSSGTAFEQIRLLDDLGAWLALEKPISDDRRCRAPRQRHARLVHKERPVGIAVEGHAHVGPFGGEHNHQVSEVVHVQRIGRMVGERAIRFEIEAQQFGIEPVEHRRQNLSRHPVASIHGNPQPANLGGVHATQKMLDITRCRIEVVDPPGGPCNGPRCEGIREIQDLGQARIGAYGRGLPVTHLDAVVFGRIVRGGYDRSRHVMEPPSSNR